MKKKYIVGLVLLFLFSMILDIYLERDNIEKVKVTDLSLNITGFEYSSGFRRTSLNTELAYDDKNYECLLNTESLNSVLSNEYSISTKILKISGEITLNKKEKKIIYIIVSKINNTEVNLFSLRCEKK